MKRASRAVFPAIVAATLMASSLVMSPPAGADPRTGAQNLQTRLGPTGVTSAASGVVRYKAVRSFRRLTIETHGLFPGVYDVFIAGGVVGSMEVVEGAVEGEGSGRFVLDSRTAGRMIFDPRGTSVEIVNQQNGETELETDHFPANKREEMARAKIAIAFRSTDVQPAASGETTFRSFGGRARFVVKVAGLAPGDYDLMVGGGTQGRIHITSLNEVALTFDTIPQDPVEASNDETQDAEGLVDGSRSLLTFDPRGFPIAVSKNGVDLLVIAQYPS